jgi:hypothetical protein
MKNASTDKKTRTSASHPVLTVCMWLAILFTFVWFKWEIFSEAFETDSSGMSYWIVVLFFVGAVLAVRAAATLQKNWRTLFACEDSLQMPEIKENNFFQIGYLMSNALELQQDRGSVDIDQLLDTFVARHNSRIRFIGGLGAILITLGLLGTIIGLLMSVQGLGDIAGEAGSQAGLSESAMKEGLSDTINGMGTAFYTTLFGALFGGVVLRILAVNLSNSLSELTADAGEFIYHVLLPPGFGDRSVPSFGGGGPLSSGDAVDGALSAAVPAGPPAGGRHHPGTGAGAPPVAGGGQAGTAVSDDAFSELFSALEEVTNELSVHLEDLRRRVDRSTEELGRLGRMRFENEADMMPGVVNLAASMLDRGQQAET